MKDNPVVYVVTEEWFDYHDGDDEKEVVAVFIQESEAKQYVKDNAQNGLKYFIERFQTK